MINKRLIYVNSYEETVSALNGYNHLLVYGAGELATSFFLSSEHIINTFVKVDIVQSEFSDEKQFFGRTIHTRDYLRTCDKEKSILVLAINENNQKAVLELINKDYEGNIVCLGGNAIREIIYERVKMDKEKNHVFSVYYSDVPNMGDQLNRMIFEDIYKVGIRREKVEWCNAAGIGSNLGEFFKELNSINTCPYSVDVMGMGFMNDIELDNKEPVRNMNLLLVRGDNSLKKIEKRYGQTRKCKTGDPGLLAYYFMNNPNKKFPVGIIPHWKEKNLPVIADLCRDVKGAHVIDLTEDPYKVLEEIEECETIISSSLHGCIVADAFNIPNKLVKISDIPLGDGYKYRDYYSIYGIDQGPIPLGEIKEVNAKKLREDYIISYNDVKNKTIEVKKIYDEYLNNKD